MRVVTFLIQTKSVAAEKTPVFPIILSVGSAFRPRLFRPQGLSKKQQKTTKKKRPCSDKKMKQIQVLEKWNPVAVANNHISCWLNWLVSNIAFEAIYT